MSGLAFALTSHALRTVWSRQKSIFSCHKSTGESTLNGEYNLSRTLLDAGLNIDTLLVKYGRVDWVNKANWKCNNCLNPLIGENYVTVSGAKIRVSPLEVVFYRPVWTSQRDVVSETFSQETLAYMDWAVQRKNKVQIA
jgi:hypothetical protein